MKYVVVDIDGTIAHMGDRIKYLKEKPIDWEAFYGSCFDDEPIAPIVELVQDLMEHNFIVFCTARRESVREQTKAWLEKHLNVYCPLIIMRPDGDHRSDTEVKPEQLFKLIPKAEIAFVLEDRKQMVDKWRELGITCLQVASGDY